MKPDADRLQIERDQAAPAEQRKDDVGRVAREQKHAADRTKDQAEAKPAPAEKPSPKEETEEVKKHA